MAALATALDAGEEEALVRTLHRVRQQVWTRGDAQAAGALAKCPDLVGALVRGATGPRVHAAYTLLTAVARSEGGHALAAAFEAADALRPALEVLLDGTCHARAACEVCAQAVQGTWAEPCAAAAPVVAVLGFLPCLPNLGSAMRACADARRAVLEYVGATAHPRLAAAAVGVAAAALPALACEGHTSPEADAVWGASMGALRDGPQACRAAVLKAVAAVCQACGPGTAHPVKTWLARRGVLEALATVQADVAEHAAAALAHLVRRHPENVDTACRGPLGDKLVQTLLVACLRDSDVGSLSAADAVLELAAHDTGRALLRKHRMWRLFAAQVVKPGYCVEYLTRAYRAVRVLTCSDPEARVEAARSQGLLTALSAHLRVRYHAKLTVAALALVHALAGGLDVAKDAMFGVGVFLPVLSAVRCVNVDVVEAAVATLHTLLTRETPDAQRNAGILAQSFAVVAPLCEVVENPSWPTAVTYQHAVACLGLLLEANEEGGSNAVADALRADTSLRKALARLAHFGNPHEVLQHHARTLMDTLYGWDPVSPEAIGECAKAVAGAVLVLIAVASPDAARCDKCDASTRADTVCVVCPCSHTFHKSCWKRESAKEACPNCRFSLARHFFDSMKVSALHPDDFSG